MTEEELVAMLMESPEVIHKAIWNAAIEAAAKVATECGGVTYVDEEIRKLKKG